VGKKRSSSSISSSSDNTITKYKFDCDFSEKLQAKIDKVWSDSDFKLKEETLEHQHFEVLIEHAEKLSNDVKKYYLNLVDEFRKTYQGLGTKNNDEYFDVRIPIVINDGPNAPSGQIINFEYRFRSSDLYIMGYKKKEHGKFALFNNYKSNTFESEVDIMNFPDNYDNLGIDQTLVFQPSILAQVGSGDKNNAKSIAASTFILSEAIRNSHIADHMSEALRSNKQVALITKLHGGKAIIDLAKNWSSLSKDSNKDKYGIALMPS
jgi:hypothetical protein